MSSLWPSPDELASLDEGEPPMADYLRYLRTIIAVVDAAMAAEGVDPDVRDRVVERLVGTPEPDEPQPVRAPGPPTNAAGW